MMYNRLGFGRTVMTVIWIPTVESCAPPSISMTPHGTAAMISQVNAQPTAVRSPYFGQRAEQTP